MNTRSNDVHDVPCDVMANVWQAIGSAGRGTRTFRCALLLRRDGPTRRSQSLNLTGVDKNDSFKVQFGDAMWQVYTSLIRSHKVSEVSDSESMRVASEVHWNSLQQLARRTRNGFRLIWKPQLQCYWGANFDLRRATGIIPVYNGVHEQNAVRDPWQRSFFTRPRWIQSCCRFIQLSCLIFWPYRKHSLKARCSCWRHQEKVRHQRFSRKKTLDFLESDPQSCLRMSKVSKILSSPITLCDCHMETWEIWSDLGVPWL